MDAPLFNRLKQYSAKNRISFAMPGHKGKLAHELFAPDVTELSHTAELHAESDAVKEANTKLSEYYGSKKSFILSSGSTTAIQAMLAAAVKPGDTILVSSDCHMSVINTAIVLGLKVRVAEKQIDPDFAIPMRLESVSEYLEAFSDIAAVVITSPNYYGICSSIHRISEECHKKKIPLICDEAHGAHFKALGLEALSAVPYADAVCQSAHKTLNALTGAAYLHVCGDIIAPERVRECINMFETSSPSYVIAASADTARAELENSAEWKSTAGLCAEFKQSVKKAGLTVLENDDPTRLVISFNGFNLSGFEVSDMLADDFGIDVEMSDAKNIVLIATPGNTESDFNAMTDAIFKIVSESEKCGYNPDIIAPPHERGLIEPQGAFFAPEAQVLPEDAEGRISKAVVCAYPPGVPLLFPGEKITTEHIAVIRALQGSGARLIGLSNGKINVVSE